MKTKTNTSAPPTQAECTICLSNDSPDVGVLKCKHAFCFGCIESWSEHENSCPLCKVRFAFIDRFVTSPNDPNKPVKTRVKIKKRNQGDYDYTHPSPATSQGDTGADIALWANFIAGLTGQNNMMSAFLNGRDDEEYTFAQNGRYGARMMPARRYEREGDFLASAELRFNRHQVMRRTLSARPTPRATVRTHGSHAQPIELSDDETTTANQTSSSSSSSSSSGAFSRASTLAGSSASNAVDLIDLTDDTEEPTVLTIDTSASQGTSAVARSHSLFDSSRRAFTLSGSSSPVSLAHIPTHSVPERPLHPAASMSTFGNYSLMDFLSDDEEDEDYEPPVELDIDAEADDNSDVSDDMPAQNEVIELDDSESEDLGVPVPAATAAVSQRALVAGQSIVAVGANAPRLSGIMVWCQACDSYHDKQRVYDDVHHCPATYASLVSSDGFADICQEPAATSARNGASSGASSSSARGAVPLRRSSFGATRQVADGETEWTSDDSTTSEQWQPRIKRNNTGTGTRSGSPSASEWEETAIEKEVSEESLSRTQSDATTASSRSRSMSLSRQDSAQEVRTQVDEEIVGSSSFAKSLTAFNSAPVSGHSNKRANWISYMLDGEDGEDDLASERRTKQRTEKEEGTDGLLEAKV